MNTQPSLGTAPRRVPSVFVLACGLAFGLALSACADRKAEEACEDYFDAVEECSNAPTLNVQCDGVDGDSLDFWECHLDWAEGGCEGTPTCTP